MNKDIFSPIETKILKGLGRKRMTIAQLVPKVYGTKKKPLNASIMVASATRSINRKCEYHNLPWFLNGIGRGRGGKIIWKDKQ